MYLHIIPVRDCCHSEMRICYIFFPAKITGNIFVIDVSVRLGYSTETMNSSLIFWILSEVPGVFCVKYTYGDGS